MLGALTKDDAEAIDFKVGESVVAQKNWHQRGLVGNVDFLNKFIANVEKFRPLLAETVKIDVAKPDADAEVGNFITTFKDMIKLRLERAAAEEILHANYTSPGGMDVSRKKIKMPFGVGDVTTSFNFAIGVFSWTAAPMLLAGNAVNWKPSEKAVLVALAIKSLWDKTCEQEKCRELKAVLQVIIGERKASENLARHQDVKILNATGSAQMCVGMQKIWDQKKTRLVAEKKGNVAKLILEGGAINSFIISEKTEINERAKMIKAAVSTFLAGGGQNCTDIRRLFIQESIYDGTVEAFKEEIKTFIAEGNVKNPLNEGPVAKFGFRPLIDKAAYDMYVNSVAQAVAEGGKQSFGGRVLQNGESQNAYYVNPTIMEMPAQTPSVLKECFAPLLYVMKYQNFAVALELAVGPENAGLSNGIGSQDADELELYERVAGPLSGHLSENMPTGTSVPAHRLGFTGKRESGNGEPSLDWEGDPFAPYEDDWQTVRITRNRAVPVYLGRTDWSEGSG